MADSYIDFRQVDFRYDAGLGAPNWILKGFDLTIERGEFYVLLGPSGCGKTTALNLLAGFEHEHGGCSPSAAVRSPRPASTGS